MYGANYNTNSGNTVYKWSPTTGQMSINGVGQGAPAGNKIFMTIWDGGGNDTYDFSNYTTNLSVDLQPGRMDARLRRRSSPISAAATMPPATSPMRCSTMATRLADRERHRRLRQRHDHRQSGEQHPHRRRRQRRARRRRRHRHGGLFRPAVELSCWCRTPTAAGPSPI